VLENYSRPVKQQVKYEIKVYCDQISTIAMCIGTAFMQGNSSQEQTKLELENICNKVQNVIRMINQNKTEQGDVQ